MAHEEGLRRIRLIAKVLMMAGCSLFLIAVALFVHAFFLRDRGPAFAFLICGALGLYSSVLGGIIALGAWILRDSLAPRPVPPPDSPLACTATPHLKN